MTKKDLKNYFKNKRELQELEKERSKIRNKNGLQDLVKFCRVFELQRLTLDIDVAIDFLDPEDRKLLYLIYWEKVSMKKLAFSYKVSESTISRMVRKIINELGDCV